MCVFWGCYNLKKKTFLRRSGPETRTVRMCSCSLPRAALLCQIRAR